MNKVLWTKNKASFLLCRGMIYHKSQYDFEKFDIDIENDFFNNLLTLILLVKESIHICITISSKFEFL